MIFYNAFRKEASYFHDLKMVHDDNNTPDCTVFSGDEKEKFPFLVDFTLTPDLQSSLA
ncbi:hypothetical protein [Candidatus Acidianus copahuensis]|uniref:hypothetical protein n=1 Tax=Candidatus Acidianus copahuensis TaxID=1160895 RepID=UPI00135F1B29|nr:hypothetical protein [Candidatus Acidianus copahuensis]